jgi:hypothetical protein
MLLLVPILIVPWIAKVLWPHEIKFHEIAITSGISAIILMVVYAAGHIGQTSDVEIWNGEITAKTRVQGSYVRTYDCRCRQQCTGTGNSRSCREVCDTCYEDRYTVSWTARSNIGDFSIKHLDTTSRSVWLTPDPQRYVEIQVGDPASKTNGYTNYVKAVPESLFHAKLALTHQFANKLPPYPAQIYDFYKINRVLPVGVNVPDVICPLCCESLVLKNKQT